MSALAHDASRRDPVARRRWTALLLLSATLHAMVLGAFALRLPAVASAAGPPVMDVRLAPPFVRPTRSPAVAPSQPTPTRVVVLDTAPRYVAPEAAATGEASDAADLFGPVFADGHWPRPVVVRSEPCDPDEDPKRAATCRRELLFIGLASGPRAGSKAQP